MKTKYIKVAVSDRLPKQEGKYFVWVDCPNTEKEQMEFNMDKKKFYLPDNEFQSFYDVTNWLEEVEDREEEMKEMLSKLLMMFTELDSESPKRWSDEQINTVQSISELLNPTTK